MSSEFDTTLERRFNFSSQLYSFGVIKKDNNYHRIRHIFLKEANLELYFINIWFNSTKYHNLKYKSNIKVC